MPSRDNAARCQHGYLPDRPNGLDDFRDEDHGGHLAAVSPCLGALYHQHVDAGMHLLDRVLPRTNQRGDRHALGLRAPDHELRWNTERVGNQFDGMAKGHIEQLFADGVGQRCEHPERLIPDLVEAHAVLGEQLGHVIAVLVGNHRDDLFGRQVQSLALELLRTDDVDAVGLAGDVIVDPGQFVLEVLGDCGTTPRAHQSRRRWSRRRRRHGNG